MAQKCPATSVPRRPAPGAPSRRLPGLRRPGAARAAAVVVASTGRPLPMGRLRGLPAGERRRVLPLSAQRARVLFPPGRRGRSRAAGWRGRIPGSAGCGTRRGSAAPASGPRPWVAPWDAETPCCAAGRAGPGLGSGCPRRENGSRAGGNVRPGSEKAEEGGERPRGRGRGSCLEVGADPGSQERGTSEGAAPRSATNGGRARRTAQQDLSSPSPDAQLRVGKLLRRFPPPAPCGKQEPVIWRPRLGLPPPGPRGLPPTPRRCHRLRTGRMSPLFPLPPAAPGRLPREAPPGQRASFPAAPPSRGPGPGAWQAGSTPTIGAKPGNWSKGREGPDQAMVGRGAPRGARAGRLGGGQCQSWQGQSGSHGSVMGA